MSKFGRKMKQPPPGFEDVEPTLSALDNELRESKSIVIVSMNFRIIKFLHAFARCNLSVPSEVNEPHEGLRKTGRFYVRYRTYIFQTEVVPFLPSDNISRYQNPFGPSIR